MARTVTDSSTTPEASGDGPMPERGTIIGRFVVLEHLGSGGMGLVVSAYDPHLDRKVALKILRGDVWSGTLAEAGRAALMREAQSMARLAHPNVVTVHEIGFDATPPYVVMEQVSGRTLRAWSRESARGWREIVAMLVQAGEGLAAAHRAHIVHRDFKPENILVGEDSRPRVTDFGIAAAFSTLAGGTHAVAGTHGYMPPEQAAGASIDARADQYAFCVTLWEALHGALPPEEAAAPTVRRAPAWLYRVLARGLSPRPDDRFPSMDALLGAIRRQTGVRRRPATVVLAIAGLLAVGSFAVGRRLAMRPACHDGNDLVASLWSDDARERVRAAFAGTGRPYAADTFSRIDASLRRRVANWADTHDAVCAATHLRHEQSEALLDRRMECLRAGRGELEALITVFGKADAGVVDHAIEAAREGDTIAACATLGATSVMPRALESSRELDAIQGERARLSALRRVGSWKEGLKSANELVERLRRLGDTALLASAVLEAARFELEAGDADRAIDGFYEAAHLGAQVHEEEVVLDAAAGLSRAYLLSKDRLNEGRVAVRFAAASAARLGLDAARLARILHLESLLRSKEGERAYATLLAGVAVVMEALHGGIESAGVAHALVYFGDMLYSVGHARQATWVQGYSVAIGERLYGPEHPDLGDLLQSYSDRLWEVDEFDEAARVIERALAIQERAFGAKDTRVAESLYRLAIAREGQRRLPEARATIERAIRIDEELLGPGHPYVAARYEELGLIAHLEGHVAEALAVTEKAYAIRFKAYGTDRIAVGDNLVMQAGHLVSLGRHGEAQAAVEKGLAIFRKKGDSDGPYTAVGLMTLGRALLAGGRAREALAPLRRALTLYENAFGADAVAIRPALVGLADALLLTGDPAAALAIAERAVRLPARPPGEREAAQLRVAQASWALGRDRPAALATVRSVRASLAALPFPSEELPRIDRWLAQRR